MSTTIYDAINAYFDEILKEPKATLYHYTDVCGMLGILQSKKLWLTDTRFLNDPDELSYGPNQSKSMISEILLRKLEMNEWTEDSVECNVLQKIIDRLDDKAASSTTLMCIARRSAKKAICYRSGKDILTMARVSR